jgi:uncharacterized glyoxalase superfamily protein PhnB
MLRGDKKAMQILQAAGARQPQIETGRQRKPSEFARSIRTLTPMLMVADMVTTLKWYEAVGFEITGTHGEGQLDWAEVKFGAAAIMFVPTFNINPTANGVSLWIHTDRIDELYASVKRIQLDRGQRMLAGQDVESSEIAFTADLYTAFYGQQEFGIRDPNGVELMFFQPLD